jgi:hypothetical protein
MEEALSRPLPDADRRVILGIRHQQAKRTAVEKIATQLATIGHISDMNEVLKMVN